MSEISYGFVDSNGILLGTAVVMEGDTETILRIQNEEYGAVEAYQIVPEHIPMYPGETYWDNGQFYPPKIFASWLWDNDNYAWQPPIMPPDDGKVYVWDESSTSWVESA